MAPDILDHAGPLLADYDVLLCDIWGVLHSGGDAHPDAADALLRFRAKGGTVILVSNAPMAAAAVGRLLDAKKLPRDAWDTIVCSGEIALAHIAVRSYRQLHRIGPQKRDASFFDRLPGPDVPLAKADAIACTGLVDDRRETVEDYRALMLEARAHDVPLVCANPDLVVDVNGALLPCAGAIGALYEDLGGGCSGRANRIRQPTRPLWPKRTGCGASRSRPSACWRSAMLCAQISPRPRRRSTVPASMRCS